VKEEEPISAEQKTALIEQLEQELERATQEKIGQKVYVHKLVKVNKKLREDVVL
jgi:ADP-ribose pyrophosphatase YjhB (NUDIX family)